MKAIAKVKNPLASISRRSVLGVMGIGMTGVLVGCNDDLSPLSATLSSSVTEVTAAGVVTLTAKLDVGFADTVEFYEGTRLLDTVPILAGQASKQITVDAKSNGMHTYITKIMSTTGKQAYSNPIDVTVNIGVVQPPVAPTISLATSSNSVTVGGSITLTATSVTTSGNITKVEFFEGTTKLGFVVAAPFTFSTPAFTSTDNGTHSYKATVTTDASSLNTATSSAVDVVINIPVPVVTIALSSSDTTLTAAKTITLTAVVTGGTVSSINFFDGATALGAGTAGAVSGTFTKDVIIVGNPLTQTHSFTATSTFNAKPVTSNAVTVNLSIALPTIGLTASTTSVTAAGNVVLTATVTGGTVSQIEFFEGATSLGVVSASPYKTTIAFTATSPAQAHSYIAQATVVGAATTVDSAPVNVNVNIGNLAPTVSLTSSSNNLTVGGSIALTATATAKTGTISSVEFFDGATSLGVVTAAPFTKVVAFTTINNGTHNYTAKATDSSGNSATSSAVTVTVTIAATPPTIALSANPTSVAAAGSSTLTATVTAGTGTITKVDFYDSLSATPTVPVFTKTAAPYTYVPAYTTANNGTHSYTAKVTASDGGTATSTAATVTVNIAATAGTRIALYTAMTGTGSYVNFNHPTSGIKCILYRAATAQTGGVSNAGAFYVAYSRKCTHAGTIITQNPNTATPHVLTCQDHGATYNMDSNCAPINGIAPAALPSIVIKAGTDGIYI